MRILLVYPKWTGEYGIFGYFAKRSSAQPPINLAILASLAENLGHEVKIIDGEVAFSSQNNHIPLLRYNIHDKGGILQ